MLLVWAARTWFALARGVAVAGCIAAAAAAAVVRVF